jgi:glycosyltransferase involved in cell wall biosynthesis
MKMKILVLTTTFPRWENDTTPAFVFELSRRLKKSNLEIVVLAPYCEGSKKFEILDEMRIYRYPYFFPTRYQKLVYDGGIIPNLEKSNLAKVQIPFLLIFEMIYALKIVKKENIEVIHSHWIIPNGFVGALCKIFFNTPHITTAHAADVFTIEKSKILRIFGSFVLENADVITANSSFTRNSIKSIQNSVENRIQIIPMGVDKYRFSKKNQDFREKSPASRIILSIGRLVEKKGIQYLIMAMDEVIKTFPDAKLLIGGDGPEKGNLVKLCSTLKLKKNVEFLGFIPNEKIALIYETSDIFVLPSVETKYGDTEGLGVVLLEAMASGIPVIGSDIGGITDIIEDGKTGLLVKSRDSNDIAKKILFLLSNKEYCINLTRNATNLLDQKFSWDIVTKQFFEVIQNLSENKENKIFKR